MIAESVWIPFRRTKDDIKAKKEVLVQQEVMDEIN
jgi:hypothetical protein